MMTSQFILNGSGFRRAPCRNPILTIAWLVLALMASACGDDTVETTPSSETDDLGLDSGSDAGAEDILESDVTVGTDAAMDTLDTLEDGANDMVDGADGISDDTSQGDVALDSADSTNDLEAQDALDDADATPDHNYGTIETIVGSGDLLFGDGATPSGATLNAGESYSGLAVGPDGRIYVADRNHNRVRVISVDNSAINGVAGSGLFGVTLEGEANTARLFRPGSVVVSATHVYFAHPEVGEIWRVNGEGSLELVVGRGASTLEGAAGAATSLCEPRGLALDSDGNLYYADACRHHIRRVSLGVAGFPVTTVVGDPLGGRGSALGAEGRLDRPLGLGVIGASDGQLLIADSGNGRVVALQMGVDEPNLELVVSLDGASPTDVALGPDQGGQVVYLADTAGQIHRGFLGNPESFAVFGGGGEASATGEGIAIDEAFLGPIEGIAWGIAAGQLLVLSDGGRRVRTVNDEGAVTTLAGGLEGRVGDGSGARLAILNQPCRIELSDDGEGLVFADNLNQRVRRYDLGSSALSTVAGAGFTGRPGGLASDDTAAVGFSFCPLDGAFTTLSDNSIVIAQVEPVDGGGPTLWRWAPNGDVTHFAGDGSRTISGNEGPAITAGLSTTGLVAALLSDDEDRVYVVTEHRVRVIDAGQIDLVAGNGGTTATGDDGSAVQASLARIRGAALGPDGALYLSAGGVRRVDLVLGTITSFHRSLPAGPIAFDPSGDLYAFDDTRVLRAEPVGFVTVAGGLLEGSSGDGGPALAAQFGQIAAGTFTDDGRMIIVDSLFGRIRVVTP